jgi:putative spermidine/putrescine transport system substrate-binding protein
VVLVPNERSLRLLSRRRLLQAATAAGVVTSPSLARAEDKPTLVSTIFGGVYEAAYRKNFVTPFCAANNADMVLKYGTSGEWVANALINRTSPEIDVLFLAYPDSIRAVNAGLGVELTPVDVPHVVDLPPVWYDNYKKQAVGIDYASWGISYRTDSGVAAPTSWLDLFKPEYKGRVILPNLTTSGGFQTLVVMARLHGGSETDIGPGFEAMKKLKSNVRKFYVSNSEAAQLMERGDGVVGAMYDNVAWPLADGGKPVRWVVPKEGVLVGMVSLHVVPNGKHMPLAKKFVDYVISPGPQAAFCNQIIAGPVNRLAKLSEPALSRVPKLESVIAPDWFKIVQQMPDWIDRWNREIVG